MNYITLYFLMILNDVATIKEVYCCEKCTSFEYELPYQIDKLLIRAIYDLIEEKLPDIDNLVTTGFLQIKRENNFKIDLMLNKRELKLCVPKADLSFKYKFDIVLENWIFDKLGTEIE